MTDAELKEFVEKYVHALNGQDVGAVEQFHDENSVSMSGGEPNKTMGRRELRQYLEERIRAFPDAKLKATKITVNAEKGIASYDWTVTGTHTGPFKGIPPTNKRIEHHGTTELEIKNGKIIKETSHQDFGNVMRQLGIQPPPGMGGARA
jgi:steroid delta-isomerase-like uncharacterized protein